jgi:hypothetical protein
MEILNLIFSGPGATIAVCLTVLVTFILLIKFSERFEGLNLGYKGLRIELPKPLAPEPPVSVEITETPIQGVVKSNETSEASEYPLIDLFKAVDAQDRKAIDLAFNKLRENPPFGFNTHQLEMFRLNQLLMAGFLDELYHFHIKVTWLCRGMK